MKKIILIVIILIAASTFVSCSPEPIEDESPIVTEEIITTDDEVIEDEIIDEVVLEEIEEIEEVQYNSVTVKYEYVNSDFPDDGCGICVINLVGRKHYKSDYGTYYYINEDGEHIYDNVNWMNLYYDLHESSGSWYHDRENSTHNFTITDIDTYHTLYITFPPGKITITFDNGKELKFDSDVSDYSYTTKFMLYLRDYNQWVFNDEYRRYEAEMIGFEIIE